MIYLERKVDHFLRSWKEDEDRKPLIIKRSAAGGKDGIHSSFWKREL